MQLPRWSQEVVPIFPNSIYPNPTSGYLNINNQNQLWKMHDLKGTEVLRGREGRTNLSFLPAGVYLLEVNGVSKKFLKHSLCRQVKVPTKRTT